MTLKIAKSSDSIDELQAELDKLETVSEAKTEPQVLSDKAIQLSQETASIERYSIYPNH